MKKYTPHWGLSPRANWQTYSVPVSHVRPRIDTNAIQRKLVNLLKPL